MNAPLDKKEACSFCGDPVWFGQRLSDRRLLCFACRPCLFFERHLTLTDDFAGQPFTLMPWNRTVLRDVFGTLDDNGLRIYRDIYLEVTKKNTKSTFIAGLCLFVLVGQGKLGQKVYGSATTRDQAGEVYRKAAQMARRSALISAKVRILDSTTGPKRIIRRDDPDSFYAAISADGDSNDGVNPSCAVRDEVHRWRSRKELELAEVLERGMVAREEPLLLDITTAGESEDEAPLCWRRHEYCRQVNEGVFEDRQFYGRIFSADPKRIEAEPDYWKSREARVTANPSHEDNGGYLKDAALEALCIKAQNDPQARADYLRYNLGIWGQRDNRAIEMAKWYECGGGVDLRQWPTYDVDLLIRKWGLLDRPCYAGVDASWSIDLTALSLLFPACEDYPLTVMGFGWMPADRVKERQRKDRVPYSQWVEKGFIETTPGNAVDQSAIIAKLKWAREMFDLRAVMYDPWNFRQSAMKLVDEEFEVMEVRQGYATLSEPTKSLLAAYLDGDGGFRHGNNPAMNWCASCVSLQGDKKDNVQFEKPNRSKSSKRIDFMSATATAAAGALVPSDDGAFYRGGLMVLR